MRSYADTCRVVVNRRIRNEAGECVNDEPTPNNVKVNGTAVTHAHDNCGSGNPIIAHGLERAESWRDRESGEKRTKNVVVVDNRFGEVGIWLKFVFARIERTEGPSARAS